MQQPPYTQWNWQSPPPAPPSKPRYLWPIIAGVLALLLVIAIGTTAYLLGTRQQSSPGAVVVTFATSTLAPAPRQQVTTGKHVTAVSTGTGFDTQTGKVIGQKSIFSVGETVWIVYTVTNPDPGAVVSLYLYNNGAFENDSNPISLDRTTNSYANSLAVQYAGTHEVIIDYNYQQEASITFYVP